MHNVSESSSSGAQPLPENESEELDNLASTSQLSASTAQKSGGTNPLNIGFALVATFALGLALGFWGRPKIIADVPLQVVVTVVPNENGQAVAQTTAPITESSDTASESRPANSAGNNDQGAAPANETNLAQGTETQPTPTIMEFLLADARHIQGDDAAPVTIIEFSDFK